MAVALSTAKALSAVRLNLPKDLTKENSRKGVLKVCCRPQSSSSIFVAFTHFSYRLCALFDISYVSRKKFLKDFILIYFITTAITHVVMSKNNFNKINSFGFVVAV